jgi:hypothetical protein
MTAEMLIWMLLALVTLDLLALRFGVDSRFWGRPSETV